MEKAFPFTVYDVISDQSDFDADGWFDVNLAVQRTLINNSIPVANLNNYWFIDEDTLVSLNTGELTTAPDVPSGAANAGQPVPAANMIPIEKIAIRFEIREVVNKPLNQFNIIPGSGKTLNSAVVNNNPMFFKLAITELETLGSCTPINGTLHAKYTIYHPHLRAAYMHLNNNSNTVSRYITGDGFLTLNGNINVQFREGRDGLRLLEINPRMSGGIAMASLAGPNLPYLAIAAFDRGVTAVDVPPINVGIRVGERNNAVVLS